VDDLSGLDLRGRIQIGPYTEIVVSTRSPYSRVPGHLQIGDRTVIGSGSNLRAAGGAIRIGSDCLIAQQVSLIASGHTLRAGATYHELPWDDARTGITIEDNVWLGCGVVVLPGCTIGRGAVIGAGSVVTRNVPPNTICAGVPAKPLRLVT
jgi:acetyltransferase-like isoleucine patch superfamily enzyme